jgi:hypothetical protein
VFLVFNAEVKKVMLSMSGWNCITWSTFRYALQRHSTCVSDHTATALRSKKAKSVRNMVSCFYQ